VTSSKALSGAVFGASGNIGSHVVEQLLAAGHRVTAYVRNPGKLNTTSKSRAWAVDVIMQDRSTGQE
jgi:uncharacterized protein YbjT (DUF2867 family)